MPAKFQVYKDEEGKYRFRLRAENNEIIAAGEAYEQHAGCLKGIQSIQKNCNSSVEDLTVEGGEKITNPKYQLYSDTKGLFRFRLKASNGETIAQSEGYETKDSCMNGIEAFRKGSDAEIEDETVVEEESKHAPEAQLSIAKPVSEINVSLTIKRPEKTVFVGNKTPMDYALAIITGFSTGDGKVMTLKARGQAITTAVDAAEITRKRFLKDLKIDKIAIGTEEMPPREGETRPRKVSTIEIVLTKG